ncbi:MAG: CotH kinase family protein [Verrucomicrobiota bacterium]|nr:CotH kinase family protein [Limisphaera sp.]MDW8382637.1 CotH kinase family protein [Verrucomicrobiota bacterium]
MSAAAFSNALHWGRHYETNVYLPQVWLDNGATNRHVGARFRGNTSYTMSGPRKSLNLQFDFIIPDEDLMGSETINLNNAAGDETVMREPLFFTLMSRYAACPRAAMCQLYANGTLWSVYSLVEQADRQFLRRWFPSANGDLWRAPNAAGGGGFASSNSAYVLFPNRDAWYYTNHYTLKATRTNLLTALQRLTNAIAVLHQTPSNRLRDVCEDYWAVDHWLWFLALENLFVDDDSYWNKGADYMFYYEAESGRFHPVEHDGNEAFAAIGSVNYSLSPVQGANGNNRPLLYRWLTIPELRQRYVAHMRTALQEAFRPEILTPLIDAFHRLSVHALMEDPRRGYTMVAYTNDWVALKNYVTNRYNFLVRHAELTSPPPHILWVKGPTQMVYATNVPQITACVVSRSNSGVDSVWLYFRDKPYGRFTVRQMFDDGQHGDGAAGDAIYGVSTTNFFAGNKIHFYVEARATNAARATIFSPERAERVTYSYRVELMAAASSRVVLNEILADNRSTLMDPQGEFDDWIELHNVTDEPVDLTGMYLTDRATNPRKWAFPPGTILPPRGFLIVWADEAGSAALALHANFRLDREGEELLLVDTDARHNQVLDRVVFGPQQPDVSYGRLAENADAWGFMVPTPGAPNQ